MTCDAAHRMVSVVFTGLLVAVSAGAGAQQTSSHPAGQDSSAKSKAKKIWTNDDLPSAGSTSSSAEAGSQAPGSESSPAKRCATAPLHASQGFGGKYAPAEQRALEDAVAIYALETGACAQWLKRACSLDELLQPIKDPKGRIIGLARDPRDGSSYDYDLTVSGKDWEFTASPQSGGLGGFYGDAKGVHFNPDGRARKTDPLARYELNVKDVLCDTEPEPFKPK